MPPSHIVRFKILRLECGSIPSGQQYTITYCRGDTHCSTPCYTAADGVVDFSPMPEGAAIVHFKSGGPRFLPKWITFRVEEFTRGLPRKTVGETQVDCAEVLGPHSATASASRRVVFDMYGAAAHLTVALLVYPEGHAPLAFGSLVPAPQAKGGHKNAAARVEARRVDRSEAMALLVALETLVERQRTGGGGGGGGGGGDSAMARRLAQLEERRRALASVEGMAAAVVKKRTEDVVVAQFLALSRKHRANYVGEVAAYLRQLAVTSGVPLTSDISEEKVPNVEESRERLQRINARIDTLTQQVRKLEEERQTLEYSRHRANVTNELSAVVAKLETVQSQINLLTKSRTTLESVVHGKGLNSTPVVREVHEIRSRIQTLTGEEEKLRETVRHMTIIAANHVLKWARSKNPPVEDFAMDLSGLLGATAKQEENTQGGLTVKERDQVVEALSNAIKDTSSKTTSKVSEEKKAPKYSQVDMHGAKGLPAAKDFGDSEKNAGSGGMFSGFASTNPAKRHVDPFISDLGSHMFASSQSEESRESMSEEKSGRQATAGVDGRNMFLHSAHGEGASSSGNLPFVDDDPIYDFRPTSNPTAKKPPVIEIDDSSFFQTFSEDAVGKPPNHTSNTGNRASRDADGDLSSALPAYNFGSDSEANKSHAKKTFDLPTYNFGS